MYTHWVWLQQINCHKIINGTAKMLGFRKVNFFLMCESESCSVVSNSLWCHELYSPWNSPDQNTGVVVAFPFSRGSSQLMCQTQVSHTAGGFLTSWATGKSKNTGVGSLLLLQRIFLTQESNQCLQHCRLILHQLSYQATTFLTWGHNNAIMPPKKLANSYTCFY